MDNPLLEEGKKVMREQIGVKPSMLIHLNPDGSADVFTIDEDGEVSFNRVNKEDIKNYA